jgi:hypothetical protein
LLCSWLCLAGADAFFFFFFFTVIWVLNIEFNNKIPVGVDGGHCSAVGFTVGSKVVLIVRFALGFAFGIAVTVGRIGSEVKVTQMRK